MHKIPTYELGVMILGWGAEVEVMEPDSLRERVKGIIEEMRKIY